MKKEFSVAWNASRQRRKQRKYVHNAPLHVRRRMMSVRLGAAVRAQYSTRNMPVRKDDVVKVVRGDHKGKQGKVLRVSLKRYHVYIEGVEQMRKNGAGVPLGVHPSNLELVEVNKDDKKRVEFLKQYEKKQTGEKKPTKKKEVEEKKNE